MDENAELRRVAAKAKALKITMDKVAESSVPDHAKW